MHREVVEVLLDVQDDPEAAERPGVSGVEPGATAVRVECVAHSQVGHCDVEKLPTRPVAGLPHAVSVNRGVSM